MLNGVITATSLTVDNGITKMKKSPLFVKSNNQQAVII